LASSRMLPEIVIVLFDLNYLDYPLSDFSSGVDITIRLDEHQEPVFGGECLYGLATRQVGTRTYLILYVRLVL
jgi:hypothetical protein